MIVAPAMIQKQREILLFEIVSDDENMFPNHEITHDNECNEHICEENNPVTNLLTNFLMDYLHVELSPCFST